MEDPQDPPSSPHPALFYAMVYFRLRELLAVRSVCRSLKDAVDSDLLIWRCVTVDRPLSWKVTDSILLKLTAKAEGRLIFLALIDCVHVTDDGLRRVAEANPGITKLYVPGCVSLSAAGIVRVVQMLGNLKSLRLYGLLNITKHHLDSLNTLLHANLIRPPMFYNIPLQLSFDSHPVDVDICPKCKNARLVFDCPRERCREMKDRLFPCRGCFFCIARCQECGGCISFNDQVEETVGSHLLCLECSLKLPKCMLCNKPSCSPHLWLDAGSAGSSSTFVCDLCKFQPDFYDI